MFAALSAVVMTGVGTGRLSGFDLAVVGFYLCGITLFGLRFRKKAGGPERSLKSYFLADNTIPWWAIALSIVSAETSTLTIISIPGVAFAGNFGFLQVVIGYMVGRVVVAALFLPKYFAGEMMTAYQLIDQRFGPMLHKVTAALFLLTRAAAEGVRVFAVSIVVGIAIGTKDVLSIGIISALTLLYTFEGGMAAVVWTDVVQMAIYIGGTVVAIVTLGTHVQGGWGHIDAMAAAAGKFHMLNFAMNLTTTYTFWAGLLGGTFLTMASHGTDQLMVQRLLAAKNLKESRAALLSSGVVIFLQFSLFLLIGVGLWVFYGQHPGTAFRTNDYIFPTFIVREMPIGVAGVLVAAILAAAMSNLSAALNSLSSTTVVDFYMRLRPAADERERTLISKSSTVMWALVLFAIAVYSVGAGGKGHVVEIGLSIASVAYGCLLGVFLLGTLTKFATEWGAAVGMVVGFALNIWLWKGTFPVHVVGVTIPQIAWTWFVLIGAGVTFGVGMLASVVLRRPVRMVAAAVVLVLLAAPAAGVAQEKVPDFSGVSALINENIAEHKLPGAVLVVGHGGRVVFEKAYGAREYKGEPGIDGQPLLRAEPMTEDTIFDMASLTKCIATTTAILQMYEQGKLNFDDPVEKYLPDFANPGDERRAKVTIRMLLTHTSGEPEDVPLKDGWGLTGPDKAEGFARALQAPLKSAPGAVFRYSDINFILLGYIVETLTGQTLDVYTREHVFRRMLMMDTRYLPVDKACGLSSYFPVYSKAAEDAMKSKSGVNLATCDQPNSWMASDIVPRVAPTQHDNEGDAQTNPHFDVLLRGTVHDPTTRRMGGVAGHAGLFSTAKDVSMFAQGLLDRMAGRPSNFPVKQETLQMAATPEQPATVEPETIITRDPSRVVPTELATKGTPLRGFGWDINTAFSRPRGAVFPTAAPSVPSSAQPSFGHTGFTGTSLWMDPGSDTYVVLLANAVHPHGNTPISRLRGEVATAVAEALGLYGSCEPKVNCAAMAKQPEAPAAKAETPKPTLSGIDSLEAQKFAALKTIAARNGGRLRMGVLTNQTGVDAKGKRTIDVLAKDAPKFVAGAKLVTLFSPEHGIFGKQDTTAMQAEVDPATGLPVTSLYGPHDADKRPSHEALKDLDAVVIDLQDAGVRFYTYESVMGYFIEAAAKEKTEYQHDLEIVVLDRPDLVGGEAVQGPVSETGFESYINYMPEPMREGMTMGELARFINGEKHLYASLTVVPLEHWTRDQWYDQTGLPWVNPSPNLRNMMAAALYPGLGFFDPTNLSVGRGTSSPFEIFGAGVPAPDKTTGKQEPAWFKGADVAAALNARQIPGVSFGATTIEVAEDSNHYPYHGQTIEAVRMTVTDRRGLDACEMGVEILSVLHKLYPEQFKMERAFRYVANKATNDALARGDDARTIAESWNEALMDYQLRRGFYLLY
ncbi:MAG: sodium/solute symporter [Acidobacteriota bacterium]